MLELLFLRRRREQRRSFPRWRAGRRIFCFVLFLFRPTFSKKEQFPFPPGSQVHGTTVCDALPTHSRPWPILPVAKRVRFGDDIPPHAPLASPVRDPGSSVRMPQNAPPSAPSTPTPFRCTTTGTSIVPLEPLAQRLEAWLTLPSLSCWLTRTIRLGYAIQFAWRPPKLNGVLETSVAVRNAPVLREEIAVLLAKDAIELVPPAEMRQGFYSPYFIVPKKGGGLRPILDLRVLMLRGFAQAPVQDADAQAHDQMHSAPGLVCSDRPEGRLLSRFDPSATDRFYGLRSKVGHGSTGSSPSGSPCLPVCSRRLYRAPLPRYGKWASGSSTTSMIGLF